MVMGCVILLCMNAINWAHRGAPLHLFYNITFWAKYDNSLGREGGYIPTLQKKRQWFGALADLSVSGGDQSAYNWAKIFSVCSTASVKPSRPRSRASSGIVRAGSMRMTSGLFRV